MELRKQHQIKISKRFAVSENLNDGEDINRPYENIKENIKSSATESVRQYEVKQHKQRFYKEASPIKSKEIG
jgi:hypothetical protein